MKHSARQVVTSQRTSIQVRWFCLVLLVLSGGKPLTAAERLFEQEPFDHVVVNQEGDHLDLKVMPLDLPGRRVPKDPLPTSTLKLQLFSRPEIDYEVQWQYVVRIDLFEETILVEANQLVATSAFDEAYDYYDFLLKNHKDLPGLAGAVEEYLSNNAAVSFKAGKYDDALSLLLELHKRNPNRKGLTTAINRITDKMIEKHVVKQDYASARDTLTHLTTILPNTLGTATQKWRNRLPQEAKKWLSQARVHFAAGRNREALQAISEVRAIWPDLEGTEELKQQIYSNYSQIIVGVMQPAGNQRTTRLDDWASFRTARLIRRSLFELQGYSTEGGRYGCPYGNVQQDDSGLHLSIDLRQGIRSSANNHTLTGHDLSQKLFTLADPDSRVFRSAWGDIFQSVSVESVYRVRVDLRRPHVRPEALLLGASPEGDAGGDRWAQNGPYRTAERTDRQVRYVANEAPLAAGTASTQEIVEEWFSDADAAVKALQRGEIDLVDRISPRLIATLKSSPQITVGRYLLPTVHVLIPNVDKPLVGNRDFRRALVYGINRQAIVDKVILGSGPRQGFVTVSGPFAVGESLQDPIAYATDRQIAARPHEPRLALTLATLAARTFGDPGGADGEAGKIPTLVLAHSNEPVAQSACETIRYQLSLIGIPIALRELGPDDLAGSNLDYDLLYAELMMWEPVVDSHVLLGDGGMNGHSSSYMNLALRKLDTARNWREVRSRLRDIHRVVHNDVAVIPLWQTINYFAYRKSLKNVGDRLISLYQNVEQWETHTDE